MDWEALIARVHGALTDAGSVVVPGTLEGDLVPAIQQLVRERDDARRMGEKTCAELVRERDEARAEVARLRNRAVCIEIERDEFARAAYERGLAIGDDRDMVREELSDERVLHSQAVAQRDEYIVRVEAAEAEVERLKGAIYEAEKDIKALGIEAHPAVLMRMDRLVRAALLREVAEAPTDQERNCVKLGRAVERKLVLAEVRRVIEGVRADLSAVGGAVVCDEILARLEKL